MIRIFGWLGLMVATSISAADWPQWRGPNRNGISSETAWTTAWPTNGPQQLWKLNVGTGCSSVAVSRGRLYTLGNTGDTDTVFCVDANTGAARWQHAYACPLDANLFEGGPAATPTVDGDRVYTLSRAGHLFCLQADSGKVIWSKHLQEDLGGKPSTWGYAGSPLVSGDWLILDVGAPGGATVALQKLTGEVVWKNGDDPTGYGTVTEFVLQGKPHLASFNVAGLTVRERAGGKEIARFPWKTKYDVNAVTPIVAGDKIFISSGYGTGGALLQLTNSELTVVWQNKEMANHMSNCVLWQEHLYGFDEGQLKCVEFATGTVKWAQDGLGKGALMLAGGQLVIQGESGDLAVAEASPAAYKELARAKVLTGRCWVVPVLANGRVYVKNNKGDLVGLDVAPKEK